MEEATPNVIDEIAKMAQTGKISGSNKEEFAKLLRRAMIERTTPYKEEAFRRLIKAVNNRMERYDLRVMELGVGFIMSGAAYDAWGIKIQLRDAYKDFRVDWLEVGFNTPHDD